MKLEETEKLKLQYVNHIETKTTHINNIQESDVDLSEKITEKIYLKSMKRIQIGKANHLLRNGAIIVDDTDTVSLNVDKNSKTTKINLKNTKNQISHFINT